MQYSRYWLIVSLDLKEDQPVAQTLDFLWEVQQMVSQAIA